MAWGSQNIPVEQAIRSSVSPQATRCQVLDSVCKMKMQTPPNAAAAAEVSSFQHSHTLCHALSTPEPHKPDTQTVSTTLTALNTSATDPHETP